MNSEHTLPDFIVRNITKELGTHKWEFEVGGSITASNHTKWELLDRLKGRPAFMCKQNQADSGGRNFGILELYRSVYGIEQWQIRHEHSHEVLTVLEYQSPLETRILRLDLGGTSD